MAKATPKISVNKKKLKKDLEKKEPSRPNITLRFDRALFDSFRNKAEKEGYSANKVLEALMRSYLDK